MKSVVNKNQNNYYYNMFLEKGMRINPIHIFRNECLYTENAIFL